MPGGALVNQLSLQPARRVCARCERPGDGRGVNIDAWRVKGAQFAGRQPRGRPRERLPVRRRREPCHALLQGVQPGRRRGVGHPGRYRSPVVRTWPKGDMRAARRWPAGIERGALRHRQGAGGQWRNVAVGDAQGQWRAASTTAVTSPVRSSPFGANVALGSMGGGQVGFGLNFARDVTGGSPSV